MDYYIYQDDNGSAVRTDIDLSLIDKAPQDERSWLLWAFVKIKSPNKTFWCEERECEALLNIRIRLEEQVEKSLDGVLAAVRMQDGWQELYFYAPGAKKFENSVKEVMRSFDGYAFETGSTKDRKWEKYIRELYPDLLMAQQIESRYIINELEEAGDRLESEREVEHYLFFQTDAQAQRAQESLRGSGYFLKEIVNQEGDYSHGIVMTKEHAVNEEKLMEETAIMIKASADEYGIYEGWSTVLAK